MKKELTSKINIVVAIDTGDKVSGVLVLSNGEISFAENTDNVKLFDVIKKYTGIKYKLRVVVEDIRPYSLKLTPQVIETCKYIGELKYRLKTARIAYKLVSRNEVKAWIYRTFPDVVEELIRSKINKRGLINKDGSERKTSFIWVDDRIIVACMKKHYGIEQKKGQRNKYGVSTHTWQALALGLGYLLTKFKKK